MTQWPVAARRLLSMLVKLLGSSFDTENWVLLALSNGAVR